MQQRTLKGFWILMSLFCKGHIYWSHSKFTYFTLSSFYRDCTETRLNKYYYNRHGILFYLIGTGYHFQYWYMGRRGGEMSNRKSILVSSDGQYKICSVIGRAQQPCQHQNRRNSIWPWGKIGCVCVCLRVFLNSCPLRRVAGNVSIAHWVSEKRSLIFLIHLWRCLSVCDILYRVLSDWPI